jgi:DNA polymerase-3 subunit epsilon
VNPERESDEKALEVHGLTTERLRDEPKFAEIAPALIEFIRGAELIIHNAPFDVGFLNREFELAGLSPLSEYCPSVIDTWVLAKELHPGKRNNLDALCERYQIDRSRRTLHGALIDTGLLAEVYFAMTRGQDSFLGEEDEGDEVDATHSIDALRGSIRVLRATDEELAQHAQQLTDIAKDSKGKCLWLEASKPDLSPPLQGEG